ncbi:hypothetical protein ACJMK2_003814 [Sinanodonta woodiana]|uniref:Uncharacterized protein n=1 Tax=Sinanodonta woodiana TaxID=1069815 RepID=A0ABD3Y137_SINWO
MEGVINFVAMGICALALILDIVAIALPSWFSDSYGSYGLWKSCSSGNKCMDLVLDADGSGFTKYFIMAIRGLTIVGVLLLAAAVGMTVLKLFVMKDKIVLSSWASGSANTAGSLIMIAVVLFVVKTLALSQQKPEVLGDGFRVAVAAGVISIVAGILFKLGKDKTVEA